MSAFTPPKILEGRRWFGLRVGLLGGSFHPSHEGHVRLSCTALKMLGLDFIWWLVTPKNPIKDTVSAASFEQRLKAARQMAAPCPRILVSRLEKDLASTYSYQTLQGIRRYFPETSFVWLCGFDLALNFHRWHKAAVLPDLASFAFFARPPAYQLVANNMLAMRGDLAHRHIPHTHNRPDLSPRTIYWAREVPMHDISSSRLRGL